eukprot:209095_1
MSQFIFLRILSISVIIHQRFHTDKYRFTHKYNQHHITTQIYILPIDHCLIASYPMKRIIRCLSKCDINICCHQYQPPHTTINCRSNLILSPVFHASNNKTQHDPNRQYNENNTTHRIENPDAMSTNGPDTSIAIT